MARRLTRPQPAQGAHLAALRKAAGFSQSALAQRIGEPQQNIAHWELSDKPPRSDVLPKLAQVLGVRVEELLNVEAAQEAAARKGPSAKVRQLFEEVSALPRAQQDKVIEFVRPFVKQCQQSKAASNS